MKLEIFTLSELEDMRASVLSEIDIITKRKELLDSLLVKLIKAIEDKSSNEQTV